MSNKVIGELIGVIAIATSFFVFLSNQRKRILVMKGILDALWALNSFFIGAFTGVVLHFVMIFREFVFYHRIEKKWARSKLWMYFFCAMCFVSPMLEVIKQGAFIWVPFIPACGSVAAVFGLYDKNPQRIRIINFCASVPWLIYAIFTSNITQIISTLVVLGSIIVGAIAARGKKTE